MPHLSADGVKGSVLTVGLAFMNEGPRMAIRYELWHHNVTELKAYLDSKAISKDFLKELLEQRE